MSISKSEIVSLYQNVIVIVKCFDENNILKSTGNGVLIRDKNVVITNYHTTKSYKSIEIYVQNKIIKNFGIIYISPEKDMVALSIDTLENNNSFNIENNIKIAERIYILSYDRNNILQVHNSQIQRTNIKLPKSILPWGHQNDSLISFNGEFVKGDSGGLLVNEFGHAIGIVSSRDRNSSKTNYAIPFSEIEKEYDSEDWMKESNGEFQASLYFYIDLEKEDYISALTQLEELLKLNPKNKLFISFKAHLLTMTNQYKLAEDYILDKIKEFPDIKTFYYCLGMISRAKFDFEAAEKYFKMGLKTGKYYIDYYYELLSLYNFQENFSKSLSVLNKGIKLFPESFHLFNERAKIRMTRGEYTRALEDFNISLCLKPENYVANKGLGIIYFEKKKYDEALNYFIKSIELIKLVPSHDNITKEERQVYEYLWRCYFFQSKYEELILSLNPLILQKKYLEDVYSMKGRCYLQLNDLENAEKFIKKSLEINKEMAKNFYLLSQIYFKRNNLNEALEFIYEALYIEPLSKNYSKLKKAILTKLYGADSLSVPLTSRVWFFFFKLKNKLKMIFSKDDH